MTANRNEPPDDMMAHEVLMLHLAATLFMVGVIWFVQVVHYPLLASVGRAEAAAYEQQFPVMAISA